VVRRSIRLAAISFAALAAVPNDVLAEVQGASRNAWALLAERATGREDKPETLRVLSPAGVSPAEFGWVKASDLKPGAGLQLDLAAGLALRAEWERYRPRGVQARETVDTLLLGLQFAFH
jgi:hypothetical protein